MLTVGIVMGTRPEIMKMYGIIKTLLAKRVDIKVIWTGQHYDRLMFDVFLHELKLPEPTENLNVGSGSHADQVAKMLSSLEKSFKRYNIDFVVSLGDTNSTLAAALATVKMGIPFIHLEAGMRSYDPFMPEETNRKVADAVAFYHFAPTINAAINLIKEGKLPHLIEISGDTLVHTLTHALKMVAKKESKVLDELNLDRNNYIIATVHREENTNNIDRLREIFSAFNDLSNHIKVVVPLHPRTAKRLRMLRFKPAEGLSLLRPLSYIEFISVLRNALFVITDSGGVQEEAFILKKPCLTLRLNTEWVETLIAGANKLVGYRKKDIVSNAIKYLNNLPRLEYDYRDYLGDECAPMRIAERIMYFLENKQLLHRYAGFLNNQKDHGIVKTIITKANNLSGYDVWTLFNDYGIGVARIYVDGKMLYPYLRYKFNGNELVELIGNNSNIAKLLGAK